MFLQLLWRYKILNRAPRHLFNSIPEHVGHRLIDEHGAMGFVQGPDAFLASFEEPPIPFLALPEMRFRLHAAGDIDGDQQHCGFAPGTFAKRMGIYDRGKRLPRFSRQHYFTVPPAFAGFNGSGNRADIIPNPVREQSGKRAPGDFLSFAREEPFGPGTDLQDPGFGAGLADNDKSHLICGLEYRLQTGFALAQLIRGFAHLNAQQHDKRRTH